MLIERRSAEPLVRLSIFSVKTVRGANAAMFVVAAGLFAMFFFNTLYVQRVLGFSPLEAGFAFVPFTAGIITGAGLSQKLVPALGAREVPLIGSAIGAVGLLTFLRLTPDSSYVTDLLPGILLTSVGMGLVFVPITLIATSGVPHDDAGLASGLFNTAQQIGGALGLALLTTLATSKTKDELASLGHRPTQAEEAEALVSGFHVTWLASAILLAAGGLLLLVLLRRRDVVAVVQGEAAPGRRLGGAPLDDVVERAAKARGERAGQDGRLAERGHLDARGVRDPALEPRAHGLEEEVAVRAEAAAEDDERDVGDGGDGDDVERDPARDLVDDLAPRARRPRAPRRRSRARRTAA